MKNQVTKKEFIEWMFADKDDLILDKNEIIDTLVNEGQYTITVKGLYESVGYIPQYICVNDDGDEEYHPSEVELIN